MIYIHTINHFLNGVGSSQMLCGTPEWKGLCVRVSLARATNNYLIAGGAFSFKLEISHLEFRSSGEKNPQFKSQSESLSPRWSGKHTLTKHKTTHRNHPVDCKMFKHYKCDLANMFSRINAWIMFALKFFQIQ